MAKATTSSLSDVLVAQGVLSKSQAKEAEARKAETGKGLVAVVVELGFATVEQVMAAIAEHEGRRFYDLTVDAPDMTAATMMPGDLAREHLVLPVGFSGDRLIVAMTDPKNTQALEDV